MKVAIIGSGNLKINNIEKYIPKNISLLVAGGASCVKSFAKQYAKKHIIPI